MPPSAKQMLARADKARDAKDYVKAAFFYEKFLAENPHDVAIHIQCGHMQKECGRLDEAGKHYLTAYRLAPHDADLQVQLGHYYKVCGDLDDAIAAYRRAIELDPTNADARFELAVALDLAPAGLTTASPVLDPPPELRSDLLDLPEAAALAAVPVHHTTESSAPDPTAELNSRLLDLPRAATLDAVAVDQSTEPFAPEPTPEFSSELLNTRFAAALDSVALRHSIESSGADSTPEISSALLDLPLVGNCSPPGSSPAFAEEVYLSVNPDIVDDKPAMAGMQHWLNCGWLEDIRGERPRLSGYVETLYLRYNPDVAGQVGSGMILSGYDHFLRYGLAEGRQWSGSRWRNIEQQHIALALTTRTNFSDIAVDTVWPKISVIVPVYNPSTAALRECIDSVRQQSYPNWEMVLADDGSYHPATLEVLLEAARADARIRVVFAGHNGGISAASNHAFAGSEGEFVALVDNDDILAPDALLHVARAFTSGPDVDLVYTDEAKLAEDGKPFGLNPKPDWSPELLLSTMYIGHLTAYRRSMVAELGGFRSFFDGTQDYDLALRAAEVVRSVVHVPLPLYFWRLSHTSTAGSITAKPGVLDLQRQALEGALIRRRQLGTVLPGHSPGHWRVDLSIPKDTPLVSVVIPTAGRTAKLGGTTIDLVVNCIRSIQKSESYPNYEFVVVHNDDLRPETLAALNAISNLRLIAYRSAKFNLSDKINLGVRSAAGPFVLLLNDDMQTSSTGVIRSMIGRMFDGVGVVGGRLLYANGTLQHAGIVWMGDGPTHAMIGEQRLIGGPAERLRVMHNCLGVSGACMLFRRDVFLHHGGFSPRSPTNYNDVDFCLRLRQEGLRIVFNPEVTMFHFESLSKDGTHFWELQLLQLAYPDLVDPYWNPTFSLSSPFYELRDIKNPAPQSYVCWLLKRITQRQKVATRSQSIRLSIIMSVYQNRKYQMEELEATIFNQTYQNWEWVIVDDGSTLPETLEWLKGVQLRPGVKLLRLEKNQGIMAGYGTAFRAASGDYVVPVDADDFLTLDCLQILATAIEDAEFPDVVYSDEDKATESGALHSPFLKPDWDPVLFTNICYVCHVCAIKRSTAEAVGCYTDVAASWCHDWDSLWRLHRHGARIVHVPEVLYSWRIHPGSTASISTGTKPKTIDSQKHVLEQHLRLSGMDRHLDIVPNELFPHDGIWRLKPNATYASRSAILLVVSAEMRHLSTVLLDLAQSMEPEILLLVVGESDQLASMLRQITPELKVLLGFPADGTLRALSLEDALCRCADEGRERVAVVDLGVGRLNPTWLCEGLGMFEAAPDVGAVSGEVLLPDGTVAWRGGFRGFGGMAGSPDYRRASTDSGYHGMNWCQRSCDSVPSVCFFARTDLLRKAAAGLGAQPLSLRHLTGQVSAVAWQDNLRIVHTPFVQATLARETAVDPILPANPGPGQAKARYYPAGFGTKLETAYALCDIT